MNILIINGQNVTSWTTGLEGLSISFVLNNSDRTTSYSASGLFTVGGSGYNLLKNLITNINLSYEAVLKLEGVGDLAFVINARNVRDCGCEAEIIIQSDPDDLRKYQKLTDTIVSDDINQLFESGFLSRIPYCNEPNFITYVLLSLYLVFRALIDFIVFVVSIWDDDVTFESFRNFVVGCARFHWSFNVNRTARYYSEKAGLNWSSTILANDFPDLNLLDGYGYEGEQRRFLNINQAPGIIINYTIPQILRELSHVFNADYRVINGTLHFQRKDWFPANARQIVGKLSEEFCVEVDPSQLNTNIKFQWATDVMDETSNIVTPTYSGRVDHNPLESPVLRGTRTITPRIAVSRFVNDRWGDGFIRKFRNSELFGSSVQDDLILSNGQTLELRILDIQNSGGPYRYAKKIGFTPGPRLYQERLLFTKYQPDVNVSDIGLYANYWDIENPNTHPRFYAATIKIEVSDVCQTIEDIQSFNLNVYFQTEYGRALPEEIEYDQETSIFTLKNCTIWP